MPLADGGIMKLRRGAETIEEVWADAPEMECKGLCQASCGPVGMGPAEMERLIEAGYEPPILENELRHLYAVGPDHYHCPLLTKAGRCSAYALRPTVCRMWGAVEEMPCPHGCMPKGGRLRKREGALLMLRALFARGTNVHADSPFAPRPE